MSEKGDSVNSEPIPKPARDARGFFLPGNQIARGKAGSRHKATRLAMELLDGAGEEVMQRAIDLAKDGDPQMIRLIVERLVPVRKSAPMTISLPALETPADAKRAVTEIVRAQAAGETMADEAEGRTISAPQPEEPRCQQRLGFMFR